MRRPAQARGFRPGRVMNTKVIFAHYPTLTGSPMHDNGFVSTRLQAGRYSSPIVGLRPLVVPVASLPMFGISKREGTRSSESHPAAVNPAGVSVLRPRRR